MQVRRKRIREGKGSEGEELAVVLNLRVYQP